MKCERGIGFLALIFSILVIGVFIAFSIYLIRLDNIIRNKFEGQRWDIPAKVFARPLEIYANAPITQENFIQELKLLGYKNTTNYEKSGSYVTQGSQMYVHTRGFDYGDSNEPEQVLEIGFINGQVGFGDDLVVAVHPERHDIDQEQVRADRMPAEPEDEE